eukprot:m.77411 g.77411  ORF g.77411 m.77411 type:complete len:174 (+) comp11915_c0_seq6:870-1391(+)
MAPLKVVAAVVNGAAAISVFNASTSSCENAATKLSLTLTHNEKGEITDAVVDVSYSTVRVGDGVVQSVNVLFAQNSPRYSVSGRPGYIVGQPLRFQAGGGFLHSFEQSPSPGYQSCEDVIASPLLFGVDTVSSCQFRSPHCGSCGALSQRIAAVWRCCVRGMCYVCCVVRLNP